MASDLMSEIEKILWKDPSRMYSEEEILNLLAPKKKDKVLELLPAELEVELTYGKQNRSLCKMQGWDRLLQVEQELVFLGKHCDAF